MNRIYRRKLLLPDPVGSLPRPRLLDLLADAQVVALQAPAGAGKTAVLVQWLHHRQHARVYYELNADDRDAGVFAAHLLAAFRSLWPGWNPPETVADDPCELAVELVSEAAARPPVDLALDRLEWAFGEAYLADFLQVVIRYAPRGMGLALGSRAPLPVDAPRLLTAPDLAFTRVEAANFLGGQGWEECWTATGGLPLALALWKQNADGWHLPLVQHLAAEMPPHISPDHGRELAADWLSGRLTLESFAHQVSQARPGAEALWRELHQARHRFTQGEFRQAQADLAQLWAGARGRGDRPLMGAVALLTGETYYGLGEYAMAREWYRQAFAAAPGLELTGTHCLPFILRDLGFAEEAESLASRCVAATSTTGDLQAQSFARMQYAWLCADRRRFDEARREMATAVELGQKSSEPLYGLIAMIHQAGVASMAGNAAEYRQVAERAYTLARGRSPWLEALAGYILAGVLFAWGDPETGARLMASSLEVLTRVDAKFQVHMLLAIQAGAAWKAGQQEQARLLFDRSVALAAREGYLYILLSQRFGQLPLLIDALVRGVEVAHCQRALVMMGEHALPSLLALAESPEAGARRAALYPLAAIGGEEAGATIRRLLCDEDEGVRDAALLACRSTGGEQPSPAPAAGVHALEVSLLGPITIKVGGQPVQSWRTSKARDLLAFLLLAGDRPFTRDQLAEALWPEGEAEAAFRLLHTTLHHLRRALGPLGERIITFAGGAYRLMREVAPISVDAEQLQRLAAAGTEQGWRAAVALCRGDLLEGLDYPWCEAPRARARSLYLDSLRHLSRHLTQSHRWSEAVECLQLLVQADPLGEDGHVALMECFAATGNRNAAIQQYRTLVRLLDDELGLTPSPGAEALYQQLLQ